ncbi:glycosyltransferase family 2 protein [Rutstroemia sp. NJR-2017a WRK4]|nr:glycosyltransferase family 2 protein [Rutstroemia sp. NJR-2017a WRK4]
MSSSEEFNFHLPSASHVESNTRHVQTSQMMTESSQMTTRPSMAERHQSVPVLPRSQTESEFASAHQSRPHSIMSTGSAGSRDRHQLVAKYLQRRCAAAKWQQPIEEEDGTVRESSWVGVAMKLPDGSYCTEPPNADNHFYSAMQQLNSKVAFTMSSDITAALMDQITPFQTELQVHPRGIRLQIVQNLAELADGQTGVSKRSYMCILREERLVLIWNDSVEGILTHGADVEGILVGLIWGSHIGTMAATSPYASMTPPQQTPGQTPGRTPSAISEDPEFNEKMGIVQAAIEREENKENIFNPDLESATPPERPFLLIHAGVIGFALTLVVFVEMLCASRLITEYEWDGGVIRFALVAVIPFFVMFSLFFMVVIAGSLFQLVGPLTWVRQNSRFYSAKPPKRGRYPDLELPHITIQMPVYKEGLKGVIIPTVTSILAAIRYYEAQGGSASIYVNEDGMQAVDPELAEARKTFYELNNIGYCSRPKHTHSKKKWYQGKKVQDNPEGFIRAGQFKKASNMNYCLHFSIRVEDELLRLIGEKCAAEGRHTDDITVEEENVLYKQALDTCIEQDEGRTWAGGNVRIGDIILIIDSDTRVPEDCLLLGALEMHESPEVAILQHASGVMQVANNPFENGITYFTNLIYMSIMFAVGNGDCAPFVGHNAFLRWKAVQSVAYEEDGQLKFWSDVSEDFDMSLRLQMAKFIVRLATYHEGGFKEGVSLTVYDELARWEKYAYGCNELVFNPIHRWWKGPFTKLFLRFLWSDIKLTSKVTILAYIGTYYAIACAIPLTLANYIMVGWFNDSLDQFYLTSWKIFVGMAVIFNVLSPLAFAMLRHRLGEKIFVKSVLETAKWTPMFILFFGGISFHLLIAILCHFFSIKMEWTATAKEVEAGGFRIGLDKIVRDFKWMYLAIVPVMGGMIYLGTYAPRGWLVTDFTAIVPLSNQVACHILLPFALGLF